MIIDLEKEDMSLSEALFIAKPYDTIYLADKTYKEKLFIDKPNLTFIGRDNSKIELDSYSDLIDLSTGKKIGTTGSSVVRVSDLANHSTFINITFLNSHLRTTKESGDQAVAFKSEASYTLIKNCKFISCQDTLYIDGGIMNLIIDSYVEGDVDFIFGSADCVFKNLTVKSKENNQLSYYTAPSTLAQNRRGFIFLDSRFEQQCIHKSYVGRAWYPTSSKSPIIPREKFINCEFKGNIELDLIKMKENDPNYQILDFYNSKLNEALIKNTFDLDETKNYIDEVLKVHNIQ